jgi:hypothetical protein
VNKEQLLNRPMPIQPSTGGTTVANQIKVGFDVLAVDQWTFDPPELDVRGKGWITFLKDPGNASWSFVCVDVLGVKWPQQNNNGVTIQVDDPGDKGTFTYTVTVNDGKKDHTSPAVRIDQDDPPIIKNEGTET